MNAFASIGRKLPAGKDLRGFAIPALVLVLWLLLVDSGYYSSPLLTPFTKVLSAPLTDPEGVKIWLSLAYSAGRICVGFLLGAGLGIAAGLALGMIRPAQAAVSPTIHTLRQIALFAWIPLLTAWFGNGETAKIVFISISAFFPTFLNTELGVRTIPLSYREVALVSRLPWWKRTTRLVLPGALPSILIGIEIALLTSWIGTIGAEYAIGSGRGLGSFLAAARELFRMDLVLAGVVILALVGYGLSLISRALYNRLIPWKVR